MKLPYKITEAGSRLYRAGVSYHAFGTIKQGNAAMFDYFKCDKLTAEQAATLRQYCPDMQVRTASPMYAPELKSVAILFPKAAWYRTNGVKK